METATKVNLLVNQIKKHLSALSECAANKNYTEFKTKTSELLIFIDNLCEVKENSGESTVTENNVYKSMEMLNDDHLPVIIKNEGNLDLLYEHIVGLTKPILD